MEKNVKKQSFKFEIIEEEDLLEMGAYTEGCSGGRSDCCTRVCTRMGELATAEEWGEYLEINAGVIQY